MKTLILKKAILPLIALASVQSAAVTHLAPTSAPAAGYVYVTQVERCSEARDSRAPARYYFGFYINSRPGSYSPGDDQRVYLWLANCDSSDRCAWVSGAVRKLQ